MFMKECKAKIVIADAEKQNRTLLADILKDKYEVLEAENGVQAVAHIEKNRNELAAILLGIVLPQMDGFEVLKVLLKQEQQTIPVIALSTPVADRFSEYAYEAGVCDYVYPPYNSEDVLQTVEEAIMQFTKKP